MQDIVGPTMTGESGMCEGVGAFEIPLPSYQAFPQIVKHEYGGSPEPIKIKLEKNSKGYNFEISVSGGDVDEILAKIADAKKKLESEYGGI